MAIRLLLCVLLLPLTARAQVTGPLLKTQWHQEEPYNMCCPEIKGEKTIVGCVATALTEIMYTYKWPQETRDTLHGWSTDDYELADILPGARIDWEYILPDYEGQYTDRQAQAVARLSLMAGMACHMNYGTASSGANTYNYLETLQPVFGYPYVHMYDRAYHSPHTWRSILVYELQQGHPLLYTGYSQLFSGHAFVIDGYDPATGLFHAGWGYGGAYNKWVDIDVMNQFEDTADPTPWGRREGLFCNQTALAFSPYECEPFKADSLALDVTLDSISFPKPLCVGNSCEAVFHFTNNTADTLTYTYEVLSNAPQDTALFEQADYVGLSAVVLPPHASTSDPVLLRIKQAGTRLLRVSPDDEWLSQQTTVEISAEEQPFSIGDLEMIALGEDYATFTIGCEGQALITWCLFPDESMQTDTDSRHWSLGQDTITFRNLEPGHTYTLVLRQPWTIRHKLTFTTVPSDVQSPYALRSKDAYYDLQGRRHDGKPRTPIYIWNGKKIAR